MPKLTKMAVDALPPGDRDRIIWDSLLPGFGVRVIPSGVKTYVVQYRNQFGRSRRYAIGKHGILTADQARREAQILLSDVARGIDPAGDREAKRTAQTITEVCDRYLDEHLALRNKPRTVHEFTRLVDKHIKPRLGTLKVTAIRRSDVIRMHTTMSATPRQANTTLSVLSKIMNLAEAWELRPEGTNPCRRIERYPENVRQRVLSEHEFQSLGKVLDKATKENTELPGVINAIRLLAFTGCRLNEILTLPRAAVDLDATEIFLEDAKAGARVHSIGKHSVELLKRIFATSQSPWVVHGPDRSRYLSGNTMQKSWRRIRARAGLGDVRLHDLRHTVGTYAGQTGANAFQIRDKLGHKTIAVTNRYVSRDVKPLNALSDAIEMRIQNGLSGNKAKIILLKRNKRS